jgi:dolichol kinase
MISLVAVFLILSSRLLARSLLNASLPGQPLRIKVLHILGGIALSLIGLLHGTGGVATIMAACLVSYGAYEWFRWVAKAKVPIITEALVLVGSPEEFEATPYLNPMYGFVGIILVSAFFPPRVACAAMVVLALGDGVAGLVGRAAGKHVLRTREHKSIEGSLAGFAASFTGCLFLVPTELAFVGALVGMTSEVFLTSLDDNLTVPLSSALAIAVTKTLFYQ